MAHNNKWLGLPGVVEAKPISDLQSAYKLLDEYITKYKNAKNTYNLHEARETLFDVMTSPSTEGTYGFNPYLFDASKLNNVIFDIEEYRKKLPENEDNLITVVAILNQKIAELKEKGKNLYANNEYEVGGRRKRKSRKTLRKTRKIRTHRKQRTHRK